MFEIGKRYWLQMHGKFNMGSRFNGTIEAIDEHFVKLVDCKSLFVEGTTIVVGINHIEAIWPAD